MNYLLGTLFLIQLNFRVKSFQYNVQRIKQYYVAERIATCSNSHAYNNSQRQRQRARSRSLTTFHLANNNNEDNNDEFDFGAFRRGSDVTDLPEKASFGTESVPELQRPANEYLELVRSPLFAWASSDKGLLVRLAVVYVGIFGLVSYPVAGATFTEEGYLYQKLAAANVGSLGLVVVLLVRLYSGWGYVGSRLSSNFVEYEESGWYDGAVEKKTKSERARDLFLYRTDVKPVVDRVKSFSIVAAALWVASCVALNAATNAKPMFNSYDPDMLKQLQADEKLADYAAQKSQGKPTYCNNRYYRAIATGGQSGC